MDCPLSKLSTNELAQLACLDVDTEDGRRLSFNASCTLLERRGVRRERMPIGRWNELVTYAQHTPIMTDAERDAALARVMR